MEYLSKILGSTPKVELNEPPDHLATFTKSWLRVKDTLERPDERQLTRGIISTDVPAELRVMAETIVRESTTVDVNTTGACFEYLLKNDVLNIVVRLSEKDRPFGVRAEVVKEMLNLVVLMDEHFLVHAAVHKAILRLLRACVRDESQSFDGGTKVMGAARDSTRSAPSDYEEDLVDLMCVLCSRIRTYHELLLIFFYDKHLYHAREALEGEEGKEDEDDDPDASFSPPKLLSPRRSISPTPSSATITSAPTSSVYRKPEYDFLLYNYLLRFVHREGKIGDLARAGLLFLIDVAMSAGEQPWRPFSGASSPPTSTDPLVDAAAAFAEYILEGDFADVLAAALGAVYSLLPSKLIMRREGSADEKSGGMVLGGLQPDPDEESELEVELERSRAFGLDVSTSSDFKARLDHFVKMIEFVQDVIQRQPQPVLGEATPPGSSVGSSIAASILEFLRSSFLTNVLYPSILECSDADGSAVAVLTYINAILSTVRNDQLAEVIIDFLMNEEEQKEVSKDAPSLLLSPGVTARRKRKPLKKKRPKSTAMALLQLEATPRPSSPYFNSLGRFTVKDLLLSNLDSKSLPTATAALRLLHTLLTQHSRLSLERLLTPLPETLSSPDAFRGRNEDHLLTPKPRITPKEDPIDNFFSSEYKATDGQASFGAEDGRPTRPSHLQHMLEVDLYRGLVARIDSSYNPDVYSSAEVQYLRDAQEALDTQDGLDTPPSEEDVPPPRRKKYRLSPTDPVLSQLLTSMQSFFAHSSEQNVALTGVISAIACNPQLSLAGWLTYDSPASSSSPPPPPPALFSALAGLTAQLPQYRTVAPHFESYLEQRRNGLLSSSRLADALNVELALPSIPHADEPPPAPDGGPTTPPKPKKARSSAFIAYFSPRRAKAHIDEDPHTPVPQAQSRRSFETPLGQHYRETAAVSLTPLKAPPPAQGPWSPARAHLGERNGDDANVSVAWGGQREQQVKSEEKVVEEETTTLSELLDNVVILEEALKELAAILQMRKVMAIDD